jgi:thiol:disulfide interchange protein
MKKIILLLAALFAVPLAARDFPKNSPKFEKSYRSAMSDAKKTGKPVILVFSASWCPPCQEMKKSVYPSKEVQEFHDKFVWADLDVDDNSNEKAGKTYGVEGIPHIQFVDSEGKAIEKQVGSSQPSEFAQKLASVLSAAKAATPAPAAK